jgi:outer membrane receptor protein involved in Fe transport
MYLSTEWHYESRRLTVQDTYTKPFLWTNLTLTTSSREGHWRGGFQVRNVLDARYRLPGGFEHLQDAIEQDGRTASVKLSYTL